MQILHVVGARPNFMKVAPVIAGIKEYPQIEQILVHTGQHYDANMSEIFFKQLSIPEPDINLGVGSASHTVQTAEIMKQFEQVIVEHIPDLVLVYGDVNSTLAASLVCAKLMIPIGHVEAGLRSNDRTMPEEINRIVTDQLADMLFTPSTDGDENLLREGIDADKIHFVGNVMIDTLVRLLPKIENITLQRPDQYVLVTLHRPSNVDNHESLAKIVETLSKISEDIPILFPIHPRTRHRLQEYGIHVPAQIQLLDPVGYLEFVSLQKDAVIVITDSGGVQEETTFLGVPCLTVRENTERPVTITSGTNQLVGQDMAVLYQSAKKILSGDKKSGTVPARWDGKAGERIAKIVFEKLHA